MMRAQLQLVGSQAGSSMIEKDAGQAGMHKEQEQEQEQPMLWANQSSLSIWFQLDQHQCDTGEVD